MVRPNFSKGDASWQRADFPQVSPGSGPVGHSRRPACPAPSGDPCSRRSDVGSAGRTDLPYPAPDHHPGAPTPGHLAGSRCCLGLPCRSSRAALPCGGSPAYAALSPPGPLALPPKLPAPGREMKGSSGRLFAPRPARRSRGPLRPRRHSRDASWYLASFAFSLDHISGRLISRTCPRPCI